MNNRVIDLSNDVSPERPMRRHGSVMDDRTSYGQQRQGRAAAAASISADVIDLVNEPTSPARSDSKPSSRVYNPYNQSRLGSPNYKRRRNDDGRTESTPSNAAAARPNISRETSQKSRDGGLITHNLLHLIDQFRNNNLITINGNATQSISSNNNNPQQPFHYTQKDTWSCGFRNLQMLISSMPQSINSIFRDGIPTINEFQSSFELLWSEGFDPTGANHHNSTMVGKVGKISWIGAVEVWSYLSFRGLDATIVQFAKNVANRSCIGAFVWAYFSRLGPECDCMAKAQMSSFEYAQHLVQAAKQIHGSVEETPSLVTCNCTLLPLYFQWAGHSVTIVGIRRERCINSNGTPSIRYHLIVFDPQKDGGMLRNKLTAQLNKRTDQRQQNCLNSMELSTERLLNKDTQVLLSIARTISEHERERCKERVSCVSFIV